MKILKIFKSHLILIFIFFSLVFSLDQFKHIKSITSLINPSDIIKFNNQIFSTTNGGAFLYDLEDNELNIIVDDLKYKDIRTMAVDADNRLWIGGNYPNGFIQILDSNLELEFLIDHANLDQINQIVFGEYFAFASCFYEQKYSIVKYSNGTNPSYLNLFNNFPYTNIVINDLEVDGDTLYVASDKGLMKANYNDFLSFSSSWLTSFNDSNTKDILINNDDIYMVVDNQIVKNNEPIATFPNDDDILDYDVDILNSQIISSAIYYLTSERFYRLNEEDDNSISTMFELPQYLKCINPCSDNYGFSDFENIDDNFYFSIKNNGVLVTDADFNILKNVIPNSLFNNLLSSIKYNNDNDYLYGISKEGGIVINNPKSIFGNTFVRNFYPINFDSNDGNVSVNEYFKKYPDNDSAFENNYHGKYLYYISGEKTPLSIEFDNNGNLYIPNSGVYPSINSGHYNAIIDSIQEDGLSIDDISFGSLYKLSIDNLNIEKSWGDEIFNGLAGITDDNDYSGNTVIHQLKMNNNSLYVLNPQAENWENEEGEQINLPICIKSENNNWTFIEDNENIQAYLPTEITLDPLNNIWIGYRSYEDDSPGGVRLIQQNNNNLWYNTSIIPELEDVNVWSLDFGRDINNNYILWTISDLGVMGYYVKLNSSYSNVLDIEIVNINPYYYYSEIPFDINSKIRVDKQNNAWITTPGNGIKVIQSNGQLWPDNSGISINNSDLLSDNIFDITFDNNGYVYISTDLGISIFKTVFSRENYLDDLSISPNPFIVNQHDGIILSNFSAGSTVQIMSLSGRVVKEFNLTYENSIFNWDGKGDDGKILKTGIYIVTAFSDSRKVQGKLAIIN